MGGGGAAAVLGGGGAAAALGGSGAAALGDAAAAAALGAAAGFCAGAGCAAGAAAGLDGGSKLSARAARSLSDWISSSRCSTSSAKASRAAAHTLTPMRLTLASIAPSSCSGSGRVRRREASAQPRRECNAASHHELLLHILRQGGDLHARFPRGDAWLRARGAAASMPKALTLLCNCQAMPTGGAHASGWATNSGLSQPKASAQVRARASFGASDSHHEGRRRSRRPAYSEALRKLRVHRVENA